ncbi:FAD binding domain-containing protein [Albidovulum sp.]|uniref:FAD binding domain-containing protein n=1 Tax=Albidovulum sp. TaxID=1872424 RepID=UPI0039B8C81D
MKPAVFDYHRPDSLEEACALLAEHGASARILAGGQSLVPLMNMRILSPAVLIDINRCRDLSYLRREDGVIACGALTRQGEAETSDLVATDLPLMAAAMPHVGVRANRNFGTVCGSLAHADPLAELPSVAVALDARFVIASSRGRREVSADEFFVSALTNCLEPDEMLAEVRLPIMPANARCAFLEIANRAHGFAVAGVAASIDLDRDGRCTRARLSAMGAGDTTARLAAVEALLEGHRLDEALIREAGAAATAAAEPAGDVHASADYRAQVIGTLVRKALGQMLNQQGGRG